MLCAGVSGNRMALRNQSSNGHIEVFHEILLNWLFLENSAETYFWPVANSQNDG